MDLPTATAVCCLSCCFFSPSPSALTSYQGPLKVQLIVLPGGLLLLPATGDGAIRVEEHRLQLVDRLRLAVSECLTLSRKEEEMELHLSNVLRWLPCSRCDVDMEG